MNVDMQNLANEIASELRAVSPYRTGNMRASISVLQVDENYCDIIIGVPYASFVNQKGIHQGWIERSVANTCRAFASNNNVEDLNLTGMITYGG